MKPAWEDLNARARGLATHLLTRPQLDALAQAPDLAALASDLARLGYPVGGLGEAERAPAALDLAVRRAAAARMRILARWCGGRTAVLTVVFEDEDRRSLRTILRGAVQGAAPELVVAGLMPTPALPERALQELARQRTPGAVAALLAAWGNPYGSALLPEASSREPDLFKLEVLLNRAFAARARGASRKAGRSGLLIDYVREVIDLENAYAALVLASQGRDVVPRDVFLPGGRRISVAAFQAAAAAGDPAAAARRLSAAFAGTPFADAFLRHGAEPGALEDAVLATQVRALRQAARAAPLGPAPLLEYLLRLRAEVRDLRRIIWGVALAAPRATLTRDLVTA